MGNEQIFRQTNQFQTRIFDQRVETRKPLYLISCQSIYKIVTYAGNLSKGM